MCSLFLEIDTKNVKSSPMIIQYRCMHACINDKLSNQEWNSNEPRPLYGWLTSAQTFGGLKMGSGER